MGQFFNPGSGQFGTSIKSDIYVDKTGLLAFTNSVLDTQRKYLCVSRPRRFGKSTALAMMAAYYGRGEDTHAVFEKFEIKYEPSFEQHLNKYNVVSLIIQNFIQPANYNIADMIALINKRVIGELREEYGGKLVKRGQTLRETIEALVLKTGTPFIFLVDEWDCIFRIRQKDEEGQKQYLEFLRNLFKDNAAIHLVYMTGILPVKKYGQHSALNMFDEYSMMDQRHLARFTGFTQEEVDALCDKYSMDRQLVREWYNGYQLRTPEEKMYEVYSPKSVVEAMYSHACDNYWNKTETFDALRKYIEYNVNGLKDTIISLLVGNRQSVNTNTFTNDMITFSTADDVLTLLIHLGYLGYDFYTKEVFIPNKEIQHEYYNCITAGEKYPEIAKAIQASRALLEAAWARDEKAVAAGVEAAHFETSQLTYNSETALSYVVSLAFYAAREYYTIIREMPAGKGFADIAFIPKSTAASNRSPHSQSFNPSIPQSFNPSIPQSPPPAMLIELKWNAKADSALKQIRDKRYPQSLEAYRDNLLLIGVNYNKKTKKHTCRITSAPSLSPNLNKVPNLVKV
jgi:hypothetical protein